MLLNYHEMTMDQSRADPAKHKQFMVVVMVMVAALAYCTMTSGILIPMEPVKGVFPGGQFCYKYTNRDYAASFGLARVITSDVIGDNRKNIAGKAAVESILYHLYLDDPSTMGGRRQRWMTGLLVADSEREKCDQLMSLNAGKKPMTSAEMIDESSAVLVFQQLPYELTDLPSVDALVLQYPNTHGFVASLMLSYHVSVYRCCV
jgi:hypothetical protein